LAVDFGKKMEQALKQEMEQLRAYTSSERLTNGSLSNVTTGLKALLEYLQTSGYTLAYHLGFFSS
jgi:hypothetical protein